MLPRLGRKQRLNKALDLKCLNLWQRLGVNQNLIHLDNTTVPLFLRSAIVPSSTQNSNTHLAKKSQALSQQQTWWTRTGGKD